MTIVIRALLIISTFAIMIYLNEEVSFYRLHSGNKEQIIKFILSSAPNFISTFFLCLVCYFSGKKNYFLYMIGLFIGTSLYEILQLFIPKRTFDLMDIAFSLIGFILAYVISAYLDKMIRKSL